MIQKLLNKDGSPNNTRILLSIIGMHIVAMLFLFLPKLFKGQKSSSSPAFVKEISVSIKSLPTPEPATTPTNTTPQTQKSRPTETQRPTQKPKKAIKKTTIKPKKTTKKTPKKAAPKATSSKSQKTTTKPKKTTKKTPKSSGPSATQLRQQQMIQNSLVNSYMQGIDRTIYSNWSQPSFSEITYQDSVLIQLKISRNGNIVSKKIIRRSRDAATNRSAEELLRRLTRMPAFPRSLKQNTITETFELKITL